MDQSFGVGRSLRAAYGALVVCRGLIGSALRLSLLVSALLAGTYGSAQANLYRYVSPFGAQVLHVEDEMGGSMQQHIALYSSARQYGNKVVIDGLCMSACTLFLGIVRPQDVCAMPGAVLGFHAARYDRFTDDGPVISPEGTRLLMSYYPRGIQTWIARQGGLTSQMLLLSGRELARFVRPCVNERFQKTRFFFTAR